MQILFVDESGTPPPPTKKDADYFVLGGFIVPEDFWQRVAADLRRAKAAFSVVGEVKWRYFAPPKAGAKPNSLSHLDAKQKELLRQQLYEIVGRYKSIKLICVATNIQKAYAERGYAKTADDLYWYSYKQLTERFQYYLQDLERTVGTGVNGIVVCDNRGPKDDQRLRELHHELLERRKAHTSTYPNLIEGLFIAPSHMSVGIQLADMVAGAVYRSLKNDWRFFKMIEGSFRTSPSGRLDGYGLVKFPKGW